MSGRYLLGIDVGTTSVKAVLVDEDSCAVQAKFSEITRANAPCAVKDSDEQSVAAILTSLNKVMARFNKPDLQRVVGIGVSGQMHGCVLWKKAQIRFSDSRICLIGDNPCSNLVTWQDKRCSDDFLSQLPSSCCSHVSTGYGCATLFWLSEHQPDKLKTFDHAGTVMDLIVWALCGVGDKVTMSDQNAASWGYYDSKNETWEELLKTAPFYHLLPQVCSSPSIAGCLVSEWMGVPGGTSVSVAMGDNQCSVKAACHEEKENCAVLSIGTSSQLSVVKRRTDHSPLGADNPLKEIPYFNGQTLLVAAALNGGNAINKFVSFLREFLTLAGITEDQVTEEKIYEIVTTSALSKKDSSICIQPRLLGERYCPTETGSVSNLKSDNITMADVSSALCRGVIDNLAQMMPRDKLMELKVTKIVGVGTGLEKNEALRDQVKKVFQLKEEVFQLKTDVDAPFGAALSLKLCFPRI